jgi:hypothetical protein
VSINRLQLESATNAPTQLSRVPSLLAELEELGREAWRISERERTVLAEIRVLREIEENL